MKDLLTALDQVLAERKQASPEHSYVASLHNAGLNKILEKIGEEATETVIAAKDFELARKNKQADTEKSALIAETADLWFHSLVMLSHCDCNANEVLNELAKRFGVSGIDEKAARNQ